MRKSLIWQSLVVTSIAISAFLAIRWFLGSQAMGGMPAHFRSQFPPTALARSGSLNVIIPALMITTLFVTIWTCLAKASWVHPKAWLGGMFLGLSIAFMWAFGFLEMGAIFPSEAPLRHVKSAVRDGVMWTAAGLAAGMVIPGCPKPTQRPFRATLRFIPWTALLFGAGHGIQFHFCFAALSHPWSPSGVGVLLGMGAAVGWMYGLMRPVWNDQTIPQRILRFVFLAVAPQWVFYTCFYALFVVLPAKELMARLVIDFGSLSFAIALAEMHSGTAWRRA